MGTNLLAVYVAGKKTLMARARQTSSACLSGEEDCLCKKSREMTLLTFGMLERGGARRRIKVNKDENKRPDGRRWRLGKEKIG